MDNKKNFRSAFLHGATPFFLAAVCLGITALALIKPMDKLKVYANIAFMDSLRSDPLADSSGNSGLVITDNDIVEFDGKTSGEGEPVRPSFGELYAVISTPAFDLDIPVYWGITPELLERGACQSSSSVVLGTDGNSVVSAHVDTYFSQLDKLKEGDEIEMLTNYGKFTYKVKELIEFGSNERKYIVPTTDNRLTLYTCKRDILGASDRRIGVICELTEKSFYVLEKEAE